MWEHLKVMGQTYQIWHKWLLKNDRWDHRRRWVSYDFAHKFIFRIKIWVTLPDQIDSVDLINLSIGDQMIDYLAQRTFDQEIGDVKGMWCYNKPIYDISIYIDCMQLPVSNLRFYQSLLSYNNKKQLVKNLNLILKNVPGVYEGQDTFLTPGFEQYEIFITGILALEVRLARLVISWSFIGKLLRLTPI